MLNGGTKSIKKRNKDSLVTAVSLMLHQACMLLASVTCVRELYSACCACLPGQGHLALCHFGCTRSLPA